MHVTGFLLSGYQDWTGLAGSWVRVRVAAVGVVNPPGDRADLLSHQLHTDLQLPHLLADGRHRPFVRGLLEGLVYCVFPWCRPAQLSPACWPFSCPRR